LIKIRKNSDIILKNKIINNLFILISAGFILVIIQISFQSTLANGIWLKQISNTTKSFSHLFFTDSLNGFACGDSGIIIHSNNGGNLWQTQNSNTYNFIYDIRFINPNTGWAIACNNFSYPDAVLLKTTNAGSNWIKYPFIDTTLLLFTLCFQNELTGWVSGYQGTILKTTNGGINWIVLQHDTSQFTYSNIYRMKSYNDRIALACGGLTDLAGVTWKFNNTNNSWLSYGFSGEPFYDICFLDSNNVFGAGGDPEFGLTIIKSSNSGLNWDFNPLYFFGVGRAISFRTPSEGWVPLSFSQAFAVTTNSGESWYEMSTPDSTILNDVMFVDSRNGWTAGNNGAIYKYNSSQIGINNISTKVNKYFSISQNYPNPFNPTTTISVQINKRSFVKIIVYDILGNNIKVLTDGFLHNGTYKFHFNGWNLPSGVYFYIIFIDDYSVAKKMVLAK
jgi:photosystem II stability/assembly factor-like uncharacterized protein